ncbi:zinc-binding dehydrogenase [Nocardia cyriacigeorgica]|uniref:Zinc-binding dehydrogenase n=2 Tax=Nocardia cyriacigeorgica TaxID=135487 RepID=A0A6P1CIM3_9NOCA|nr:zinc-binding dehydrogenase [Nocardia cyriacigeorgica]MBF6289264.1 zinc-binding dehydrogenase [Nocardia cyriacigeorgica]NEW32400.1 zinc-binding dehydrogenase [Nocardia cyriacigeorgica]CCF62411.1 putative dehydrogenase [Nocardia cyriacigeorgica GUH-2]BDT86000.1 NADPH:quinone reductase [Nocardia cyriacigeorgica]BDU05513.1 NADPH:quinone reductase [Nocardia cyriacigeorgica]
MRAVYATTFGGPEVLEVREVPDPVPGAGEVLVDVAAADVMFLDTKLRSGWGTDYFPVEPPYVPGGAVAGVVAAVGPEVDPSWIGRRVATQTVRSGIGGGLPIGGYAEKSLARADTLTPVPDDVTLEQSVALTHDGKTALAVFDRAAIESGEWVLITAASGGLGTLLTQLARNAGAKVIAAARGQAKLELAERLGAAVLINYSEPGWVDQVRAATGGSGVHVVLDGAGGEPGGAAAEALADGGRFLGYGSAAGDFAGVDTESARRRSITVLGLFDITSEATDWSALAERSLREVAAGRLEVVIGQTFPLEAANSAHAAIGSRSAIGRTLLSNTNRPN